MTPAARIAAAIDILDAVNSGVAAEKALTNWARRSRYAGSGDRAAVRDHVFDALRCKRSFAWLGGSGTGRGLMLGALRAAGQNIADMFTGHGFAPPILSDAEHQSHDLAAAPRAVRLDLPDWLMPELSGSLGDDLDAVAEVLRRRAPIFLRVNAARADRALAAQNLADDGILTKPVALSATALVVTDNPRKLQQSVAYRDGLVELQDAASQAVIDSLPDVPRILDFCAGGGGKSLGLAAREGTAVFAHDSDPMRMRDIPARAARAGVEIPLLDDAGVRQNAPFDLVFCDAPCSGSGAWRRSPDSKWRLNSHRLDELKNIQSKILDEASHFVSTGGYLAYATCSLLQCENSDRTRVFLLRNPGWKLTSERTFTLLDGGDGFYLAVLTRSD